MVLVPEMAAVDSTSILKVGYDQQAQELHVQFVGGRLYVYYPVPEAGYRELLAAGSKGNYVNREIKPNYAYRAL